MTGVEGKLRPTSSFFPLPLTLQSYQVPIKSGARLYTLCPAASPHHPHSGQRPDTPVTFRHPVCFRRLPSVPSTTPGGTPALVQHCWLGHSLGLTGCAENPSLFPVGTHPVKEAPGSCDSGLQKAQVLQRRHRPEPMVRKPPVAWLARGLPASTLSTFGAATLLSGAEEAAAGAGPVDANASAVISTALSQKHIGFSGFLPE